MTYHDSRMNLSCESDAVGSSSSDSTNNEVNWASLFSNRDNYQRPDDAFNGESANNAFKSAYSIDNFSPNANTMLDTQCSGTRSMDYRFSRPESESTNSTCDTNESAGESSICSWRPDYTYSSEGVSSWLQDYRARWNEPLDIGPDCTYTVQRGDTLKSIARRMLISSGDQCPDACEIKTAIRELVDLNSSTYPSLKCNEDFIQAGWKLRIPYTQMKCPELTKIPDLCTPVIDQKPVDCAPTPSQPVTPEQPPNSPEPPPNSPEPPPTSPEPAPCPVPEHPKPEPCPEPKPKCPEPEHPKPEPKCPEHPPKCDPKPEPHCDPKQEPKCDPEPEPHCDKSDREEDKEEKKEQKQEKKEEKECKQEQKQEKKEEKECKQEQKQEKKEEKECKQEQKHEEKQEQKQEPKHDPPPDSHPAPQPEHHDDHKEDKHDKKH